MLEKSSKRWSPVHRHVLLNCCCAVVHEKIQKKKKEEEAKTNPGSDEKPTQLAWEFKGGFQGTKVDRREEKKNKKELYSQGCKCVVTRFHDAFETAKKINK